jgi:hypothetical protein
MRVIDRIRAAWTALTRSPKRTAITVAGVLGSLIVGIGFSLAVNALRAADVGAAPSASADATVEPSASADPTPTGMPTPEPTPSPTAVVTPEPTAVPTPQPVPTLPPVTGECDEITVDVDGVIFVNGVRAEDPWGTEYGEQMPMALLRLAANAAGAPGTTVCLKVELPDVVVTGSLAICGEVMAHRLEPLPTPTPNEPGPTMPPGYAVPMISGVTIPDRMLDVNSYPLLDIADVVDAAACLEISASSNDVYVTVSMTICETVRLAEDGTLTVSVGDLEWSFVPEYVFDDAESLPIGQTVMAGLDIRNHKDDVIHLVEMSVWTNSDCP